MTDDETDAFKAQLEADAWCATRTAQRQRVRDEIEDFLRTLIGEHPGEDAAILVMNEIVAGSVPYVTVTD